MSCLDSDPPTPSTFLGHPVELHHGPSNVVGYRNTSTGTTQWFRINDDGSVEEIDHAWR